MMRKKQKANIVTGLDIGSTAIRIAVGQQSFDNQNMSDVKIIGAVEVPSEGIQKGVITSIDETVSSLTHGLEQIERLIGIPIESTWVGISGMHILSQESRGVVAVAKPQGEITQEDVDRAVEAAKMIAPPLNYEVLHVLPKSYTVDGQEGIRNPVGMTGIRLEVETEIIYGITAHIKNITKAVYRTGVDIDDLVLSILATGELVTTHHQKDLGVAVVDIGGSITSLVIFEGGDIAHTATLPIGSVHITNDLAIGLRTSIDTAERIKIGYAHCIADHFSKRDKIDLSKMGSEESEEVSCRYISEIAGARVSEILEKVDEELRSVNLSGLLPAGVVFTGGGSKIGGLATLSKKILKLPASIGYPINIQSISDKANDISFTGAMGLVAWGTSIFGVRGFKKHSIINETGKIVQKLENVWKSLIP